MKIKAKIIFLAFIQFVLVHNLFAEEMTTNCNNEETYEAHQLLSEEIDAVVDQVPKVDWKVPSICSVPVLTEDGKSFLDYENRCSFYACAEKSVVEAGVCKKDDPRSYFLNYGQKYCMRFTSETAKKLSEKALLWLNKTLICLQKAIIGFCIEKSCSTCDKIRQYSYESHAGCYTDSGLCYLGPSDIVSIGLTPDQGDLFNSDGIKQVLEVAGLCGGTLLEDTLEYSKKGLEAFSDKAREWGKKVKRIFGGEAENERVID